MSLERHDETLQDLMIVTDLATARQLPEDEALRLQRVAEQHAKTTEGVFDQPRDETADAAMAIFGLYNAAALLNTLMVEHVNTLGEMDAEEKKARDRQRQGEEE